MFYVIPAEALLDPLILNKMQIIGLDVIKAPDSSRFPYWYEFVVKGKAEIILPPLQSTIKSDWYSASFNGGDVTIIFKDKVFKVIENDALTAQAELARQWGLDHNIQSTYLDWKERQNVYLAKLESARTEGINVL